MNTYRWGVIAVLYDAHQYMPNVTVFYLLNYCLKWSFTIMALIFQQPLVLVVNSSPKSDLRPFPKTCGGPDLTSRGDSLSPNILFHVYYILTPKSEKIPSSFSTKKYIKIRRNGECLVAGRRGWSLAKDSFSRTTTRDDSQPTVRSATAAAAASPLRYLRYATSNWTDSSLYHSLGIEYYRWYNNSLLRWII